MSEMEVDQNSEENITESENQGDNSNSTPGSTDQVTESGTTSEYPDLWLDFKCVFCNQDLKNITQPKLLPCLHTACHSCLTTESSTGSEATASGRCKKAAKRVKAGRNKRNVKHSVSVSGVKQLLCPTCSQEINIDDTVDHLFLVEYAQNSENLPEESSYPCTSCEEGAEGSAFCQDCQEWLCDTCVSAHHRVRVTKDHIVRPKEEMEGETALRNQKYLFCPVHSHEQLKLYCETCDKLTCRDCQLSDHKEHKYQFLAKACEEEKGYITELLAKIKEKQGHIENASSNLNKRHEEIKEREKIVMQEIKTFAVKFITDINKRGKALLQDLNKVCTDKKNQLNLKNQELRSVAERLKHCQKFAEAAITLGSETALVYSKKPIMNQLRRILRHRCEVPNPHHMVDIQFTYVSSFLAQYISSLGQILVDQQPIPGTAVNQNQMLPMPETVSQSPVPNTPPVIRQSPQMQQRAVPVPVQMNQQQQQHVGPYGQPQVTSSTDLARNVNNNIQGRQMMNNNKITYNRTIQRANMQQNQPTNFNMQPNVNYIQRNVVHQRQVAPQMRQHPQVQQQMQPQQQVQNPPAYNNTVQLPMPLRQNKSISVTALPSPAGPSPSKQRAIAPRNVNMNPMNNQANNSVQRMNTNQASMQQRTPQVIDLDGPPNQKTPTMSNTNRLSHFPNIAATLAANPGLQIQPANYNNSNFQNTRPAVQLIYNQNVLPQSVPSVNQAVRQASTLQSQPILTHQMALPSAPPLKIYSIRTSPYNSNTPVFPSPTVMSIANATVATLATNTNTVNVVSAISPAMNAANVTPTGNVINFVQVTGNIPVPNISYTPNAISNAVPQNNNLTNVINNVTVTAESSLDSSLVTDINALTITPTSGQPATLPDEKNITTNENFNLKNSHSSSSESLPSLDELLKTGDLSNVKTTENELLKTAGLFSAKTTEISNVTMSGIFEEKSKDPNEDWCAVCKDGGELLCCSYCPKVYHFGCHVPALSKHPDDDDWRCVMCKDILNCSIPNEGSKRKLLGLQGRDLLICERILLELFCHPKSSPFHNKVHKKVPNYYKIIKNPMDLSTIRMKLSPSHFEHYENISDFLADVRLIFSNCYIFNPKDSDYHCAGKLVEEFFEDLLNKYLPDYAYDTTVGQEKSKD